MEKRKIQKTGGSSLSITLPKKWTDNAKLQDKDEVFIYQNFGNVILQPGFAKQNVIKALFPIDNISKKRLFRELIAYYLSGANEIVIQSQKITPEQRNEIRNLTNAFIGFEIVDESTEEIVIKNILDDTKFPIPQRIEKMFAITKTMFEGTLRAFSENDKLLAQDIIERDFEIDKLHRAIIRQFHSLISFKVFEEELGITYIDSHYYENISTQIERIADHAVKIAKAIIVTPEKELEKIVATKSLIAITEKIIAMLDDASRIVEKLDSELAHEVLDKGDELEKAIMLMLKRRQQSEIHLVEVITEDSFDRIKGYIMNIAEMTIDQSILRNELFQK